MNKNLKYTLANDGQFDPCIMDSHGVTLAFDRMGFNLRNNNIDVLGAVHTDYRFYTRRIGVFMRSVSNLLESFMLSHNLDLTQLVMSSKEIGFPILENPLELIKATSNDRVPSNYFANYDAYGIRTEIPLYIKTYAYEYFELLIHLSDNYIAVPAKRFFANSELRTKGCYVIGDIGSKHSKLNEIITSNNSNPVDISRLAQAMLRTDRMGDMFTTQSFNTFVFKVIDEQLHDSTRLVLELPHPLNKLYSTKFQISADGVNDISLSKNSLAPFSYAILVPSKQIV